MKIYFSVSLSQMDEQLRKNCKQIISQIENQGHTVFNKRILDKKPDTYQAQSEKEALKAQRELTRLKKLADAVLVEVSRQSLGIGQEIALALSINKPVIALYEKGHQPHVLRDEGKELLFLSPYTKESLQNVVQEAIEYAADHQDVRFNFFISPSIGNYLDWISKEKKIPRSVYLRNLIEQDMEDNEEFGK